MAALGETIKTLRENCIQLLGPDNLTKGGSYDKMIGNYNCLVETQKKLDYFVKCDFAYSTTEETKTAYAAYKFCKLTKTNGNYETFYGPVNTRLCNEKLLKTYYCFYTIKKRGGSMGLVEFMRYANLNV